MIGIKRAEKEMLGSTFLPEFNHQQFVRIFIGNSLSPGLMSQFVLGNGRCHVHVQI